MKYTHVDCLQNESARASGSKARGAGKGKGKEKRHRGDDVPYYGTTCELLLYGYDSR